MTDTPLATKTVAETTFAQLGLAQPILKNLSTVNYTHPTPIQAETIPLLVQGLDVLGIAQTGTGKTAAFALPLLHQLLSTRQKTVSKAPRALVLVPTRELAVQIARSFDTYGKGLGLRYTTVVGGLSYRPQSEALARGVDILIATPGRLLDLVDRKDVTLSQVSFLVLDEADRMFDMGFIRPLQQITALVNQNRQTLLFSATMAPEVSKLAAKILKNPKRVEIAPQGRTVDKIDQGVYMVNAPTKVQLLHNLLSDARLERVVVFTRTKRGANKVALGLDQIGVTSEVIHGNKSQNARQKALDQFSRGRSRVLVATDLASRGIDVAGVTHVINYEMPTEAESYVHRIGRTARAGASGVALSFCDASERGALRSIEKLTARKIALLPLPELKVIPVLANVPVRNDLGDKPERGTSNKRDGQAQPPARASFRNKPRPQGRRDEARTRSEAFGPEGSALPRMMRQDNSAAPAAHKRQADHKGPIPGDRKRPDASRKSFARTDGPSAMPATKSWKRNGKKPPLADAQR